MTPMIAWAAGLFEGEGCVSVYTRKSGGRRPQPKVSLGMTDLAVVEQFARAIGFGSVRISERLASGKIIYRWQVASWESARAVFALLGPWLHSRRTKRFREVLSMQPSRLLGPGEYNSVKTHCCHGHRFTAANTYVHQGRRGCRACRRLASARWKREAAHVVS